MTHTYQDMLAKASAMGEKNDCTVRALAASTGLPYETCHEALRRRGRKKGRGAYNHQWVGAGEDLGFQMVNVTRQLDAYNRHFVTVQRRLPRGRRFIVRVNGHVAGFDGEKIIDWANGRRHRVREVYEVVPMAKPEFPPCVELARPTMKIFLHTVCLPKSVYLAELQRLANGCQVHHLTPPPRVQREKWAREFFMNGLLRRDQMGVIELVGDAAVNHRKATGQKGKVFMVFGYEENWVC